MSKNVSENNELTFGCATVATPSRNGSRGKINDLFISGGDIYIYTDPHQYTRNTHTNTHKWHEWQAIRCENKINRKARAQHTDAIPSAEKVLRFDSQFLFIEIFVAKKKRGKRIVAIMMILRIFRTNEA